MILERAELPIKLGQEDDFAAMMQSQGLALLSGAKGCHSVKLGRGVESPSKFILLLEWDSVEDHIALTETANFDIFKQLVGPYFAGGTNMEHFDMG